MTVAAVTFEFAWLGLGSNVGRRDAALRCMRSRLEESGLEIVSASSILLTRPVGVSGQGDFHNQVVLLRGPALDAVAWLRRAQDVEQACGRRTTYRWGPRRADCDVLLLGEDGGGIHRGDPEVPHPEIANRPFLGALIAEIRGQRASA